MDKCLLCLFSLFSFPIKQEWREEAKGNLTLPIRQNQSLAMLCIPDPRVPGHLVCGHDDAFFITTQPASLSHY